MNDHKKQRQLLEDFTAIYDEEFSADVRFLFAQGLVRFRQDDAGEPIMDLTPTGRLVAREAIRQKEEN